MSDWILIAMMIGIMIIGLFITVWLMDYIDTRLNDMEDKK
tara:strand:- start:191 stop:310 length:120 start_codon:yes stop_codon:yes gene_type:complete